MNTTRWRKLKKIYAASRKCDPDTRGKFLDQACAGDSALRREADELLAVSVDESFLRSPYRGVFSELLRQEVEDPIVGSKIGSYEVESALSSGGMGIVYLAHRADAAFEQEVAIKVIKRGMDSAAIKRRFRLEQQALGGLEHPHIARLIDGGVTEDGLNYFVMEYVQGRSIDEYCDERQLSTSQRLRLIRKVFAAVQYAHQHLVIHRDIKPSNILVTSDGEPKLLDFGIAKLLTADDSWQTPITQTGTQPIMTPMYASPEQIEGKPVSTATDVYSLGVVLYELLTGHHPHSENAGRTSEAARLTDHAPPEKPSSVVTRTGRDIDEDGSGMSAATPETVGATRGVGIDRLRRQLAGDIDNILLMALRWDPQRRYASVEQFSNDIQRHLDGLPVIAHADSVGYRLSKFVKRHKASVWAVAAIVLTLVIGVAGTVWQSRVAAKERDKAVAAQRIAGAQRDAAERQKILAEEHSRRAVEAEAAMRISADEAQHVADFLLNLFEVSDPDKARGNTITARELLDRGAARIGQELRTQPVLRAAFMHTIGRVYKKLGLFAVAADLLEQALALRRDALGERHALVADSLDALGAAYHQVGDYEKAIRLYTDSLAIRRELLGSRHPDVASSLNGLGATHFSQSEFDEAVRLHGEALTLYRDAFGDTHEAVGRSLVFLADARHASGQLEQAERLYEQALDVFRSVLGENHSAYISCLQGLANCIRDRGDLVRGKEILADVLAAHLRIYSEDHPVVAKALNHLAIAHARLGEFDEAESLFRRSLEIRRARFGPEHETVAAALNNVAAVLMSQSRNSEAEPLIRESLDIQMRIFGESHLGALEAMGNLATVEQQLGHLEEAERLSIKVLELTTKYLGEEHPNTQMAMGNLASVYELRDRVEEAATLFEKALEIRRRVYGEGHPRTLHSLINLAGTRCLLGGTDEGNSLLQEAVLHAPEVFPPDHYFHSVITGKQGACLVSAKEYERAEPLLLEAYAELKQKLGERNSGTMDVIRSLIDLYVGWEKPNETARYRKMLPDTEQRTASADTTDNK